MLQPAWLAEEAGLRAAQVAEGGRRGFVFPRSALALQEKLFTESFRATCIFSYVFLFLSARKEEPHAEPRVLLVMVRVENIFLIAFSYIFYDFHEIV